MVCLETFQDPFIIRYYDNNAFGFIYIPPTFSSTNNNSIFTYLLGGLDYIKHICNYRQISYTL